MAKKGILSLTVAENIRKKMRLCTFTLNLAQKTVLFYYKIQNIIEKGYQMAQNKWNILYLSNRFSGKNRELFDKRQESIIRKEWNLSNIGYISFSGVLALMQSRPLIFISAQCTFHFYPSFFSCRDHWVKMQFTDSMS